jgi:hypothetical protein
MFYVGQKVVCIKIGCWDYNEDPRPKFGEIVTIRGFDTHEERGLLFEEYYTKCVYRYDRTEVGFDQCRFRPLEEKKTDISILTALLNPLNHKQLEDV